MKHVVAALALALLSLLSSPAIAQTTVTRDCTVSCTLVTDAVSAPVTACRLYDSGVKVGGDWPLNAGACQFTVTIPHGTTKTYTARTTDGVDESTDSNSLTIKSRAPLPAPANLRVVTSAGSARAAPRTAP